MRRLAYTSISAQPPTARPRPGQQRCRGDGVGVVNEGNSTRLEKHLRCTDAERYTENRLACLGLLPGDAERNNREVVSRSVPAWERAMERWYKGNIHMHSLWSDGRAFPEQAVDWYKDRGYHFVSLTEHELLQNRKDKWINAGIDAPPELFDRYAERYGPEWVEKEQDGEGTRFRLKTFDEFAEKLSVHGEFLIIPGYEVNLAAEERQVHCNLLNLESVIDARSYLRGGTVACAIRRAWGALEQHGGETGRATMFSVNHPSWEYFNVSPKDLINTPEIRFFELVNGWPIHPPHPAFGSNEKFWDVVNAFRLAEGWLPLYGLAGDDRHRYDADSSGLRFTMVRAPSLTAENLLRAMRRGDFYVSTGVVLEEIALDPESYALSVKVRAEPGVSYMIRFNGAKKDFDRATTLIEDPARGAKPAREITVYSDDIGKELLRVEGAEASYSLADDDLYVRVTVVSDKEWRSGDATGFLPSREAAWSQPYSIPAAVRQWRNHMAAMPPPLAVPLLEEKIGDDAWPDDSFWARAGAFELRPGKGESATGTGRMAIADGRLWLRLLLDSPGVGARPKPEAPERDPPVWTHPDAVEFFLQPRDGGDHLHLAWDPHAFVFGHMNMGSPDRWRPDWRLWAERGADSWESRVAIPLAGLARLRPESPAAGVEWRFNVIQMPGAPGRSRAAYAPTYALHHDARYFGRLRICEKINR